MYAALLWIAVSITFSVAASAAAQENVLWWVSKIVGSYENADQPKTFRLFTAPETLTIDLLVKNESQETVSINSPAFKRGVRFDLAGTDAGDVFAEWSDALPGAGPTTTWAAAVSDRIELEPGTSVHWRIVLTQAGRSTFPVGTYRLGIRLAEIEGSLSDVTGKRWAGRFAQATVLNLVIKPPVDRIEAAASHDVNARIALENGRIAEAERELNLAAVADPNRQMHTWSSAAYFYSPEGIVKRQRRSSARYRLFRDFEAPFPVGSPWRTFMQTMKRARRMRYVALACRKTVSSARWRN